MLIAAGVVLTLAVLSEIPLALAAIGPSTTLTIGNANISPDGFSRSAVVTNGVFPGPLLTANMGNNFQINVKNTLTDATMERTTSVHWHGLFQAGTNYNDGVAMVTQCPIVPGGSYQYDFSVPGQAGTFWYHSHVGTQYCDGLRGPLVVYDPKDPHKSLYDIDNDSTVLTIADWYHNKSAEVVIPSIADSTLINGLGRYSGGPASPLSVVSVKKGTRYRMRLIVMSCGPYYTFSIDGHGMTIIEADGINTAPVIANNITVYPGQRYSFILTANQTVGNYWIRAEPRAGPDGGIAGYTGGINSGILRYSGAPVADPTTSIWSGSNINPLQEADLHPLTSPAAPGVAKPGGADVNINLDLDFNANVPEYLINNATWAAPPTPVLLQILSGKTAAQDLLPTGSVYTLPPNKVIEISIPPGNAIGSPHPFHLHGHAFSVVRTAGSSTYNYANPVQRDVVSIGYPGDNVTIRFETDNTGPWFLHCHIDFHLALGLAVVFAENPTGVAAADPVTSAWSALCPAYNSFEASLT